MNVQVNAAEKPVVSREAVEAAVREWAAKNREGLIEWRDGGQDFDFACEQILNGRCKGTLFPDANDFIAEQIARFHGPSPDSARLREVDTLEDGKAPRQSHLPARFDLLPPLAHRAVAEVLYAGNEKYGVLVDGVKTSDANWRGIPIADHLNHAAAHLNNFYAGDTSEDHLAHAATRLMFALELQRKGGAK